MGIQLSDEKVWKKFCEFFRTVKGYSDWSDEQIDLSRNDDDVEEFIAWLVNGQEKESDSNAIETAGDNVIKPKFKAGDRIRKPKIGDTTGVVVDYVCSDHYICNGVCIYFTEQDDYELFFKVCPFCGAEDTIVPSEDGDGCLYCKDCEMLFDEEDVEFEDYRHKISAICCDFMVTEDLSLKCEIILDTPDRKDLSPDKKMITDIYQGCDGIIWIKEYWEDEPKELDKYSLEDVKFIYEALEEQENEGTLSLSKTKEEIEDLIENRDVDKIDEIIREACSKIEETAWEELRIELDGDLERGITDAVYGELKTMFGLDDDDDE